MPLRPTDLRDPACVLQRRAMDDERLEDADVARRLLASVRELAEDVPRGLAPGGRRVPTARRDWGQLEEPALRARSRPERLRFGLITVLRMLSNELSFRDFGNPAFAALTHLRAVCESLDDHAPVTIDEIEELPAVDAAFLDAAFDLVSGGHGAPAPSGIVHCDGLRAALHAQQMMAVMPRSSLTMRRRRASPKSVLRPHATGCHTHRRRAAPPCREHRGGRPCSLGGSAAAGALRKQ